MIESYFIHILILIGIYAILALSLNFTFGYCGLLNLGHITFFGIGAYTAAILNLNHVSYPISFLLSGLIASFSGLLFAQATIRLRGDYFALVTLGFNFIIYSLALNWISVTGGSMGINNIIRPNIFGVGYINMEYFLFFVLLILFVIFFILNKIVNSTFGKAMGAIRDNEFFLESLGKFSFNIKRKVFLISSFLAGIAGNLYVQYIGFVDPSIFSLRETILIFTIIILGGLASLKGTIIATVFLILLPNLLIILNLPSSVLGPSIQIIYSLILIAIIFYRPRGLFGRIDLIS